MIDREKVIQHFEDTIEAIPSGNKWRVVRVDILEDAIALINEQSHIIEKYHKADGFLSAHGWRWEDD